MTQTKDDSGTEPKPATRKRPGRKPASAKTAGKVKATGKTGSDRAGGAASGNGTQANATKAKGTPVASRRPAAAKPADAKPANAKAATGKARSTRSVAAKSAEVAMRSLKPATAKKPAARKSVAKEPPAGQKPNGAAAAPSPSPKAQDKPTAGAARKPVSSDKIGPGPNELPLESYSINDPEAFAENLGKVVEQSGRVWAAYLRPREEGEARAVQADEMGEVVKTLSQVSEYWLSDPKRTLEAQTRLWSGFFNLWSSSLARVAGEEARPAIEPSPSDRRFNDPEWSRNQFFDTLKQSYLLLSDWAEDLVDEASDLDPHTKHKAQFYIKQIASALAPTNFVGTNPELIKETLASNGENLVRGLSMLAEDIQAGHGDLKVRMTDTKQFKVGENMATTPGKVVMRNDVCELLQYTPTTETVLKRPLLIVPPWINKFYILDLNAQKSFIKWAVEQGHTVFVVSWVNPDERQAHKSFEHYMREGIYASLDTISDITGERQVNTVGYCVGGTLLAVTLAHAAAIGDDRIASATFFTTQVDFTYAGDLKVFVDEAQLKMLEEQMTRRGYLDGKKMASAFNMLRANDLIWPYVINNYLKGREPLPFDLLYWNSDSTRMPAANHLFYLRNCYLDNTLSRGTMVVDGVRLDLRKVTVPVYNLATRDDHIAPAQSVFLGSQFFGGDVRFVLAGSGHIAGVINPPNKNKYQFWTGGPAEGRYEDWLAKADETAGSWWPDWQSWVEAQNDERTDARGEGSRNYPAIADAPGTYVLEKA